MSGLRIFSQAFAVWLAVFATEAAAEDFFKILSVSFHDKQPKKGSFPYKDMESAKKAKDHTFFPYLEAEVTVKTQTAASSGVYAKAYFYDKELKLFATLKEPSPVSKGDGPVTIPAFFPGGKETPLYFVVPQEALSCKGWRAVIVFGDSAAADMAVYPAGGNCSEKDFQFPERKLVDKPAFVTREKADNPLIEHVVKTNVKAQPQITLFLRRPVKARDFSETKGVLALCVLANSVADIKKRLQEADVKDDLSGPLRFAEKHNLAILCWGSRSLWNPDANWDELKRRAEAAQDHVLDGVAEAWERGVGELSRKHGIPRDNFLLWGASGSAQYAARLALRAPQHFLAVRVHIPSSFDEPTHEGSKVLWCLSTGEEEVGYDRSLRFLAACQKLGYPIIYKAIPELGHSGHPVTERLGIAFFEYALSMREEKEKFLKELPKTGSETSREKLKYPLRPWPNSFKNPEFQGDVFRQKIYTPEESASVTALLIPLPTAAIAEAWNAKK